MVKKYSFLLAICFALLLISNTHLNYTFGDTLFSYLGISPWTEGGKSGFHLPVILGLIILVIGILGTIKPFGRERNEIQEFIDYVIYIDLEPEIALGRRIYDLVTFLRSDSTVLINMLDHFLYDYLNNGIREMYIEIGKRVRDNCDLIINGNSKLQDNIEIILKKIREING
ncbi:hypothetical protein [Paenibacillus wynnii]|uniref:Uncharacterized protein n=1 Tax=Paenibacillus wynnii TaxID=268407 RepID=A0A098M437_9BACL|nr:hypothetical protein [Paenibacillus wynnii]KGE16816.1 hypothetical protein PWYN_19190 [Paenibacillus wynnii]